MNDIDNNTKYENRSSKMNVSHFRERKNEISERGKTKFRKIDENYIGL